MKYGIIVGSHRKESQSTKVASYIQSQLGECFVLDLKNNPLPLWDESLWDPSSENSSLWQPYSKELSSCDAFVIISPEWSGMATPGLKNFFLFCKHELAHKPALLVSVSAGRGGSYPIAELRMSSYKNTQICYLPIHVIVSDVKNVLNTLNLDESNKNDFYIKKRLLYSLDVLKTYAEKLQGMEIDLKDYPYGM